MSCLICAYIKCLNLNAIMFALFVLTPFMIILYSFATTQVIINDQSHCMMSYVLKVHLKWISVLIIEQEVVSVMYNFMHNIPSLFSPNPFLIILLNVKWDTSFLWIHISLHLWNKWFWCISIHVIDMSCKLNHHHC